MLYPVEESRGYEARGDLWSPGYFRARCSKRGTTRDADRLDRIVRHDERAASHAGARGRAQRRRRLIAQAAPAARRRSPRNWCSRPISSSSRRRAAQRKRRAPAPRGDEVRTVIAGYHWFTDWGRDTMISLEGLTLTTGRYDEAGYILRTFAHYVRDGLIPKCFRRARRKGCITPPTRRCGSSTRSTRYLEPPAIGSRSTRCYPKLADIVAAHVRGTRFGIGVDPRTACCAQGAEGYQLTWMDAKVGRLGRDAAPRQGGGDQRALVQRAAPDGAVGARSRATPRRATYARARRAGLAIVQRAVLVRRGRIPLRRRRQRMRRPTIAKCRPNQVFAIVAAPSRARARAMGRCRARSCASGC